nr:stalk domain-containing protein [Cohnella sp. YIM B05605]
MKKSRIIAFSLLIAVFTLSAVSVSAAASKSTSFTIHGTVARDAKFKGTWIGGKPYVDFEGLKKILPYKVSHSTWDAETKTLFFMGDAYPDLRTVQLAFKNGESFFTLDGAKIQADAPIRIVNGKMQFPLRSVAMYYELKLTWNAKRTAVDIAAGPDLKLPIVVNTAKLSQDDVDAMVDLTTKFIAYANARDFKKFTALIDSKPAKYEEYLPVFTPWDDAKNGKQTLRRIDFVSSGEVGDTVPRVIADVKWTEREMQVAYFKRKDGWTIASLD